MVLKQEVKSLRVQVKMATICQQCGGIIPDISLHGNNIDCSDHSQPEINIKYPGRAGIRGF